MNKFTYIAICILLIVSNLNAQEIKKDTICILWSKDYIPSIEVTNRYKDLLNTYSHINISEHDFTIFYIESTIHNSYDLQVNDIGLFKNKQNKDSLVLSLPKKELSYKIRELDDLYMLINDIYIKKRILNEIKFYIIDKEEFKSKDIISLYSCNLISAHDY